MLSNTSPDIIRVHWTILDSGSGPEEHGNLEKDVERYMTRFCVDVP